MNKANTDAQLILPERQPSGSRIHILGYLCRTALTFMCTYGLSVFLCDALSFGISKPTQVLVCLVFCLYYSAMAISKRFFLGGLFVGVGAVALWFFTANDISRRLTSLYYAGASVYNAWFRRLEELGYNGMLSNLIDFDYSVRKLYLTEEECRMIAYTVVIGLLCAVGSACIMRRARIFPILLVGVAVSTLIFYFGICDNNYGFSLMIASLCGIAALSYYDGVYVSKRTLKKELCTISRSKDSRRELLYTSRSNSAIGGFCGIASAMLALIVLWVPAAAKTAMRDIPSISHPMIRLEYYVMALINGDRPDINSLVFAGVTDIDRRSTAAKDRSFSGTKVFEIRSHINTPIYLRNWIGIDYKEDSWHSASYEKIDDYRKLFGKDFSPEGLTFDLLRSIDPDLTNLPTQRSAVSHTEFGYITTIVHLKKLMPSANLLFMPSYTDQTHRLLTYGTRQTEDINYSNYYDGIFTGTSYMFLDEYSAIANVPLLNKPDFAHNIGLLIDYILMQYDEILDYHDAIANGADNEELARMYEGRAAIQRPLPVRTSGGEYSFPRGEDTLTWRYVHQMSQAERDELHALYETLILYQDYVYNNYLGGCEHLDRFGKLAQEIIASSGLDSHNIRNYKGRHLAVMAIIDYLSENITYTLTPKAPSESREYVNSAETFLFDTKEGYCVQYATAAAMLLRSLGIPTRYAEGYIASEYTELPRSEGLGSYTTTIRDGDAHAWIEVYYDHYGWVQYEATAPFYAGMYEQHDSWHPPQNYSPSTGDTEPYETGDIGSFNDTSDDKTAIPTKAIIITVCVVIIATLITVAIILVRHRAQKAERSRLALISAARSRNLNPGGRIKVARALDDRIMRLLAYKKLSPMPGEHQPEFAGRVDEAFGKFSASSFSEVCRAMLVGEFGTEISYAELELIAGYYADLCDYIMRSAKFYEKPWLKYFYLV